MLQTLFKALKQLMVVTRKKWASSFIWF